MVGQTILISGTPRSGTTLACHLLTTLPNVVALHEPMRTKTFGSVATRADIGDLVAAFAAEQRHLILTEGRAVSKNEDGKVPDNPVSSTVAADGLRESLTRRGQIDVPRPATADFPLIIKHNASFAAALDVLAPRFPVFAIVRNPLATLSSWSTINIPVQAGRLPGAERITPALRRRLDAEPDVVARQLMLLDWFYTQYLTFLPPAAILKYEDVVASRGRALAVVVPAAGALAAPLANQNASKLYDPVMMDRLGQRLLNADGAYWRLYDRATVESLLAEVRAQPPG